MTNLIVRRIAGDPSLSTEREPFRWMRWEPFREMAPFGPGEERPVRYAPEFDVKETKEGFVFNADVPGLKEQDLDITMTGNRLTISGKREPEPEDRTDTYYACERSYGSFTRAFTLPEGTDGGEHIRASLHEGVLTLLLPKKPELQPRHIKVSRPKS